MDLETWEPRGNRPWRVERYGIETVPDMERRDRARDIFWIWFAANLGILAVVYGAVIASFHLNWWQGLGVIGGGVASFALVGALGVAGRDAGAPMMAISRAAFGLYGNIFPTFVSWLSLLGWETISVITGTLALTTLLGLLVPGDVVARTILAVTIMVGATLMTGLLGQATLVVVQRWAGYIFGVFTLGVAAVLISHTQWGAVFSAPPGPWLGGVLPAWSIVVAGTGLSWANAAADYSRYLPRSVSAPRIVAATTLGAGIPLVVLMVTGMLVATGDPNLAVATNPIAAIGQVLPRWMAIPYLATAAGGLVVEANLSLYSSGLNLQAMFVPGARYQTVLVDAVIMISGTLEVVLVSHDFLAPFESFVLVLGVGLAAWAGVFLVHQWLQRRNDRNNPGVTAGDTEPQRWRWVGIGSWGISGTLGLLLTATPWYTGPWAHGIFAQSSVGLVVTFLSAGLLEGAATLLTPWRKRSWRQRSARTFR